MIMPVFLLSIYSIVMFILSNLLITGTVDAATVLRAPSDPVQSWAFTSGKNKTITRGFTKPQKGIMLRVNATVDSGGTAPGRSADSPFDAIQSIDLVAGGTNIKLKPRHLRALSETWHKQALLNNDKPTVATSQGDDPFGFSVYLPFPINASEDNEIKAQIMIQMATDAQLDKSAGSYYSDFKGTVYITFIESDEAVQEMKSYEDEASGSGTLTAKFSQDHDFFYMHVTNEIETPAVPAAGADEVLYESTITDITLKPNDDEVQIDNIPLFIQLEEFAAYQNDVVIRTGHFTHRFVDAVPMKANNRFKADADGSATRMRIWGLGTP